MAFPALTRHASSTNKLQTLPIFSFSRSVALLTANNKRMSSPIWARGTPPDLDRQVGEPVPNSRAIQLARRAKLIIVRDTESAAQSQKGTKLVSRKVR